MSNTIFLDLGVIIIAATVLGHFAKKLNQPLIPAYIFAGLIIGPLAKLVLALPAIQGFLGFDVTTLIASREVIETLSEVGVAFLLFMVGLEINFKHLKEVGMISSLGGIVRCALFFFIGYIIAVLSGFAPLDAAYLGVILVFTSTMVIVKILSDKREIDSLHGKILIGMLLIEDIVALLALFFFGSLSSFSFMSLFWSVFVGGVVVLLIMLLADLIWPNVFKHAAHSKELLFLSAISVCFAFAILFNLLGFSIVIGAFIAGVTLGNLSYHFEIISRIKPLRDFFLTLFFVSLGMQLTTEGIRDLLPLLFLLLVVVVLLKPLFTMVITGLAGYKKRTAFLTGMYSSQISEFGLILVSQGFYLGHISQAIFNLTIILAILSIAFTSYMSQYNRKLFFHLSHDLELFERLGIPTLEKRKRKTSITRDVLLFGCNRIGNNILSKLKERNTIPLVIDYNPRTIRRLEDEKIPCVFGDIANEEILDSINYKKVKILISTVKDLGAESELIKRVRAVNQSCTIILTANKIKDALEFYEHGANYVILPMHLSGHHISVLLDDAKSMKNLHKKRKEHIEELHKNKHFETN